MSKINFNSISESERIDIFRQVGEANGMTPSAVEKDWWVVQVLDMVFETELSKHLVFKGGTSLSKGWKLIERFSEDVDLAIDRNFFNYAGSLSKSQIGSLRKKAGVYIEESFLKQLKTSVEQRGLNSVTVELEYGDNSDRDRSILVYYSAITGSPEYLQPRVKLEFSCRSLMEPSSMQTFGSLVDEMYSGKDFSAPQVTIPTVNPERTFLEKIFLLHEEFQRPTERIRKGDRLSRHLYDVVKLSSTDFAEKAFVTRDLYETIVEHRRQFNTVAGIDYDFHRPQFINPIPPQMVSAEWKVDYNKMVEQMIYEQHPPSFEQLIMELELLKTRINGLGW